jgi:hypothetical protein
MIFLRAVPGGWIGTVPGFVAGVLGCRWVDRGRISVCPRPNANSLQHLAVHRYNIWRARLQLAQISQRVAAVPR